MPVKTITPQHGLHQWDRYLIVMPDTLLTEIERPCCTESEVSDIDPAIDDGHAAVPASHLADHEFNASDDQAVATAMINPGPSAGAGMTDVDMTSEVALGVIRPEVARFELRRRGYSSDEVSRLEQGDWTPLSKSRP